MWRVVELEELPSGEPFAVKVCEVAMLCPIRLPDDDFYHVTKLAVEVCDIS